MLLSILFLIAWVTLMTGATAPIPSSKEIHLQILTRDFPLHISEDRISPFIFSSVKKSMLTSPYRSRHSMKVTDFRKVSKKARSPLNPGTGNVDPKVLPEREIMNPLLGFRPYPGVGDSSYPKNMNNPSQSNEVDGNNMTHLRDLRDQHMKQAEKEDGNSTFLYDDDYYYTSSLREKVNTLSVNDTASHLSDTDFHKLNLFRKTVEGDTTKSKKDENFIVSSTFGVTYTSDEELFVKRKYNTNETQRFSISSGPHSLNESERSSFSEKSINSDEKFSESLLKEHHETTFNLNITEANKMPQALTNDISGEMIDKDKRKLLKPNTEFKSEIQEGNSTLVEKVNISFHHKNKAYINTNHEDKRSKHKIIDDPSMQQDGTFEAFTKVTELSPYNDVYRNNRDRGNEFQKNEIFVKSSQSTSVLTFLITTPDTHMNDPPFRGPNVPSDIDHFDKEKDILKLDSRNPYTIVEKPPFQSLNLGQEWNNAKELGEKAWDYHCYITGSIFSIISIYSFLSLLRAKTFVTLLKTGYYITINTIILVTCALRAFYLLYDPYNFAGKLPYTLSQILLKITLPSLTSAFSFLVLSLLRLTKTQLFSPYFQNPSVLLVIIVFILSLLVTLETTVHVFNASAIILLLSYLLIIACGSFSSISYFFIFKKLHHRALRKQGEMIRLTFTKMHIDGAQLPKKLPRPTLGLAVKLALVVGIFQILQCCLTPYAMIFLRGLLSSVKIPNPWLWWSYQLSCRILELLMCGILSFIVTQPLKNFEMNNNRFFRAFMWLPCSSFIDCFRSEEIVDFEAHSDNYANPQGLRNPGLNLIGNTRRLQTNSLPTFRTPLTEVDTNLPMRTLPCNGRHTNHASALSLLSYYRSKRTLSTSNAGVFEDLERTLCNETISSSDGKTLFRPASMLYKDNGFIRFRRETDPQQPMEMSDEDENSQEDADTSLEDAESTKANIGSSFHSLLEDDVVQNTLSPFFQIDYKRRFRKMSRVSIETTDYSADVSSDQLSNVVNLRSGLSTSALDFHARKYGSTCSSESAANSFDVTFFLNSNSSPDMQNSPISTTPASLNIFSAYRSETEDDKTSSVEGHEVMLRSVSPIVKQASFGRLSLNLNLYASSDTNHSNGHANVACGTEDITPDSAVYLDLHLPRDNSMNSKISQNKLTPDHNLITQTSPEESFSKFTEDIMPLTPDTTSESPYLSPTSQSLNEIRTSNSYVVPRIKKSSRRLLCKLRGSTFSLNSAIYGYEPLEHEEKGNSFKYLKSRKKSDRSIDKRPLSEGQLETMVSTTSMESLNNITTCGSNHLRDSGLLGDCGVALVDVASQTEYSEESTYIHKSHSFTTNIPKYTGSHSQDAIQLLDRRK